MIKPDILLEQYFQEVSKKPTKSFISSAELQSSIEFVCRCLSNKAPIRFLMACLLGKIYDPKVDIRKPYTEIGGKGIFWAEVSMNSMSNLL